MANRPYNIVVYTGKGEQSYPRTVGTFWKADPDKRQIGSFTLYLFPDVVFNVFPPREREEPRKPGERWDE